VIFKHPNIPIFPSAIKNIKISFPLQHHETFEIIVEADDTDRKKVVCGKRAAANTIIFDDVYRFMIMKI
jgi:hypothetical protein